MQKNLVKTVKIRIELESLKGSVNSMMIPARGNRKAFIYSGNYRAAKKKIADYLETNYPHFKGCMEDHPEFYYTTVQYYVGDNWLTKSSKYMKLRKKDVNNYIKNAEDPIFAFAGVDDSSIIKYAPIEKVLIEPGESSTLCCVIRLYAMEANSLRHLKDVFIR